MSARNNDPLTTSDAISIDRRPARPFRRDRPRPWWVRGVDYEIRDGDVWPLPAVVGWAARVAPLLDGDAWAGVCRGEETKSFLDVTSKHPVHVDFPVRTSLPEMFAALLGHRNKVAAEVEAVGQTECLLHFAANEPFEIASRAIVLHLFPLDRHRLAQRGLMTEQGRCTAFGHKVAAVLRGER